MCVLNISRDQLQLRSETFFAKVFNFPAHAERFFTLEMFAVETKLLIVLKLTLNKTVRVGYTIIKQSSA